MDNAFAPRSPRVMHRGESGVRRRKPAYRGDYCISHSSSVIRCQTHAATGHPFAHGARP